MDTHLPDLLSTSILNRDMTKETAKPKTINRLSKSISHEQYIKLRNKGFFAADIFGGKGIIEYSSKKYKQNKPYSENSQ